MPSRRREVQDAAQEEEEAREKKKPTLVNVSGRGLCCVRKNGKLDSAGDVSMVPIGKARDQALNLKGFVWHLKFYPSTDKVPVYVDKTQNKSPDLFEKAVDSQTEFDCNFRIKGGPMWSNFINESISRAGNEVGLATYDFVKQIGPDKSQKSRDGEIWVLGPGNYMDHKGNSTTAKKIWLSPNLCKKAQDLPAVIWKTGDTEEIMASVFEVLTPFNEVPCLMGIAGGLQAMHGSVIRLETDGQLGMLMFRSKDTGTGSGGKGQGKSGAAKLLMWLTSCLENHKLDPEVSKEEFKKFANSTGLLICIEDIKNFKKLSQILAWQYDDNMTYRNKEGSYKSKGECMATGNAVHVDECHADRLAGITFDNWGYISPQEFTRKRAKFNKLLSTELRPTKFTIGEMGDFFRSDQYKERRKYYAEYLSDLCEVVKIRTLETNYAGMIATLEFIYNRFPILSTKHGISWEDTILKWIKDEWVKQIQRLHVEKDNSTNYIKRYLSGLDRFIEGMGTTQVRKFLRIAPTGKIKGQKYALAFHPDSLLPFGDLNGASLDLVKTHVIDLGGLIDHDTETTKTAWSWFVKASVDDDAEVDLTASNKEQCCNRRCILFPINLLSSSMFMRFADRTGQTDLYSLVDSETPSGVSKVGLQSTDSSNRLQSTDSSNSRPGVVHNSTAATSGNDFHLNLSAIETPAQRSQRRERLGSVERSISETTEKESSHDDVTRPSFDEMSASALQENDEQDATCHDVNRSGSLFKEISPSILENGENEETIASESDEDNNVETKKTDRRVKAGRVGKKKAEATLTTIDGRTYFPCEECNKTFTSNSGRSRHKCSKQKNETTILICCQQCDKTFQTAAGRTKHMNVKHKEANQTTKSINDDNDKSKQTKEKPKKGNDDLPNENSSGSASASASLPKKRGRKKKEASVAADPNISRMRTRNSQSM